jgi:nicotinate phosphoribosyltransferase
MQNYKPVGVTPQLVEMTRKALDSNGYGHVKIIVSGGFNPDRIAEFEKHQVPVDAYGVGSYLMRGVNAFTADVVLLEGRPCAKVGREYKPNPRLETVNSR